MRAFVYRQTTISQGSVIDQQCTYGHSLRTLAQLRVKRRMPVDREHLAKCHPSEISGTPLQSIGLISCYTHSNVLGRLTPE